MKQQIFALRVLAIAALLLGMAQAQALFAQDDGMAMPLSLIHI